MPTKVKIDHISTPDPSTSLPKCLRVTYSKQAAHGIEHEQHILHSGASADLLIEAGEQISIVEIPEAAAHGAQEPQSETAQGPAAA